MNEPPSPCCRAHREKHPPLWFSVLARRRGADDEDRTLKEVALRHQTVRPAQRIRSASTLRMNAHSSPGSATRVRARGRKAETSPRNQLLGREEPEAKQKQPWPGELITNAHQWTRTFSGKLLLVCRCIR